MNEIVIPKLNSDEICGFFASADNSIRCRAPKILHQQGDYLNKVFNFILSDSYMHPHLHPGEEKIEKMYLVKGSFALVIFDGQGKITETVILEKGCCEHVDVPAFTWHTYVMLTEEVIVYETMEGIYHPNTWKKMASWAPEENSDEAVDYLARLKEKVKR